MLVLALDTSSPAVSAAVVDLEPGPGGPTDRPGGGVHWGRSASWQVVDARRHGELLATGIRDVLAELRASPRSLGAVVAGLGPGPFTGLRVGIVTALAVGDAHGLPVYGCCSLDAVGVWEDVPRVVVTDARRKQVYWAEYDADGVRLAGPAVTTPQRLADMLRDSGWQGHVVGDGALRYRQLFAGFDVPEQPRYPAPDALVLLAARRVLDGAPAEPLSPLYLRRPDAVPPGAPKRVTA